MSVLPRKSPFKASLITGGGVIETYAPLFDGLTQYATFSDPLPMVIQDGDDFSFEVKVNRTSWPGGAFAISSRNGSSYGINLYLSGDGDNDLGSIGVFGTSLAAVGFSANVEYLIKIERVGSTWSLYVDGVKLSEKEVTLSAIPTVNKATISALDGGTFKMTGTVRDIKLSINGSLSYQLPLNQKESALQTPSAGTSNVTIINHTPAMWVKV